MVGVLVRLLANDSGAPSFSLVGRCVIKPTTNEVPAQTNQKRYNATT